MEPQPVQETPAQLTKYQQEEIAVSSNLVNAILSPNHLLFSRNVEVLAEKLRSAINEIVPGDLDSYDRLVAARLDVYERIHLELTAAETRVAYYKKYAPEEYGLAFDNARETLKESGILDVTQESLIVDYVEKVNAVREASSRLDANYDDVDPRSRIFGPQVIKELDKLEAVTKTLHGHRQEEIEKRKAQVRDIIIIILSSKTYEDVSSREGKDRLRNEIKDTINSFLVQGKIANVFFTEFIYN